MKVFQWLPLCSLIFLAHTSSSSCHKMASFSKVLETTRSNAIAQRPISISKDYETFYYDQTLDHFNYNPDSFATFRQRYVINSKYWGGATQCAPVFAYLGAESSIDNDIGGVGFLKDNAPQFKSLLVYIEHRYYGESVPYGTLEEALQNNTLRGYFNSAQALADYAEVLLHIKKNLSAHYSPIIVVGGSYGGMLASWFRLKYPHIAYGALASSAPILYFDDITPQDGYYSIVTKDFKEVSKSCYKTIRKSWSEIDEVASQPKGLSILDKRFKTCKPLNDTVELKSYLNSMYTEAAQYDMPPSYPVTVVCGGIDGAPKGTDTLGRIFNAIVAYNGNKTCYVNEYEEPSQTDIGFDWQFCSEMVFPIGVNSNESMFPMEPFNLSSYLEDCKSMYGVKPQPHWVTTYYGGHDIKTVLQNFASNIIFSNGLRDPYSSGGVLEDISKTIRAVTTVNGSHCLDMVDATPSDPQWLILQRKEEVGIIRDWLKEYYNDKQYETFIQRSTAPPLSRTLSFSYLYSFLLVSTYTLVFCKFVTSS